jgi:hypothetical protein
MLQELIFIQAAAVELYLLAVLLDQVVTAAAVMVDFLLLTQQRQLPTQAVAVAVVAEQLVSLAVMAVQVL